MTADKGRDPMPHPHRHQDSIGLRISPPLGACNRRDGRKVSPDNGHQTVDWWGAKKTQMNASELARTPDTGFPEPFSHEMTNCR